MTLTILFTAGWTLVPELISDLRDNLMVMLIGVWAMILFAQLAQKPSWQRSTNLFFLLLDWHISYKFVHHFLCHHIASEFD